MFVYVCSSQAYDRIKINKQITSKLCKRSPAVETVKQKFTKFIYTLPHIFEPGSSFSAARMSP
jgi:hypothetical protein